MTSRGTRVTSKLANLQFVKLNASLIENAVERQWLYGSFSQTKEVSGWREPRGIISDKGIIIIIVLRTTQKCCKEAVFEIPCVSCDVIKVTLVLFIPIHFKSKEFEYMY